MGSMLSLTQGNARGQCIVLTLKADHKVCKLKVYQVQEAQSQVPVMAPE